MRLRDSIVSHSIALLSMQISCMTSQSTRQPSHDC